MNAITKGYQDVPMTRRRAQLLAEYADKLAEMLENAPDDQDLAEWVQSKIDRAAGAIQSAYHYLDQEDDEELEKAVGHKYTHRKRVGTDKRGRARYRYYYAEHQGGGITRASFEAGSAFKLTWKGRRGHFHIDRVEGDQVFITHDSRPDMEPVAISKSELRALLKRQHTKAEQAHVEKRRKEVEKIKSRNVKRGLGLALHRLRQAAQVAGVELDERYQRKPKKEKKPAQVTDTPREDRFDTMPEVEAPEKGEPVQDERFEYGLELEALAKRAGLKYSEQGVTHSVDARLVRDNEPRVMISAPQLQKVYPKLTQEQVNDFKARAIAYLKEFTGDDLTEDIQHTAQSNQTRSRMIYKELDAAISHIINEVGRGGREERRATLQAVKMLAEWREATQPTPRNELTETAQQIIEEANQEHEERHDEHQEITKFELGEHTHTKTGQKLFTAKQTERVDRDEYFRRVEIAKKYRGRYERRYVKGFVFKSAEDARNFALEVEGAAQEAPETSAETVTPHEDHPSADNFETMPEVESAPRSKTPAPKTRADLAKLIHQELLSVGFKGANLWIRNEGTEREKARIYLSGKGRKQGMIEALSSQEYGSEGAFRLQVIQEEGLDGASEKEIQEAIDRRASALDLKLTPPKLDPKQLQRYLEAISAVARKLKDSAPEILDPSDRPTLALTLDYTETPLAQRSREELETLRTKARQVYVRENRPQDKNENTHAVSVARHIIREVNIALGETRARTTQPTTPREQLTETAREVTPTRTAHTIVLDRLLEAKRSGNEAQEAQINEQLRPQLMSLLEKLEQGTLDDGERQALLSRYQELQTLTTGAAQELAQEIVSRLQGADNFETMPEVESTGTPKTLLDDIRSEITIERFMREGRRREDTAEREVNKLLNDLGKLEQGLLNREYSTEAKQAKAQEILNRRLPKILEQVRRLISAKLVRPQLSGGAGQRNAARYHRALRDVGIAQDRANEEYRRALKELDRLEEKQPQTAPREQLTETAREVTQSEVLEAVKQSQVFINDLIFNKKGKLTRAANRNKIKGYSDNGAQSVAGDLVSETMREVSPYLINHTNRRSYEIQAIGDVARVLRESKGLSREEIAIRIETALKDAAQRSDVLTPPKKMNLPKRTGEVSEFGERLADRETIEIDVSSPAREQLTETVRELTAPSSPLNIDQANAQDTLTETRTRNPESKAADKALIESARELAKTSERGEEIKSAVLDLMNAQQLKRYKRATGDMSARAEDMIEKRREARERLRSATSGEVINNFETMPETEAQPKRRVKTRQEAREAQEARLVQQKTFDDETQAKIREAHSALKDRVRLNKKGEVYAIKKPSTLYYGETPLGALAGAVSSATGLSRSAAYNIVNEAVGERKTLAEIQDLLGAQIVEEKKELIRKRPAAIRMLIRNLHTNTREKIKTYTAQFNPSQRHDQRSGIGLESIDRALDAREMARNVSIYGTQDSVLTEEERYKVTYSHSMSPVSVVDRIAARYENIAELRADAEGVKQTLETFARAILKSVKESAERDLRYLKGKIDAGIKDIKEIDFKRDMLEARLARAERETSFLDDPDATREEIREIREGLDEAEQILREDTERTAQWYSAEAQRRLAENSLKTMGELTAAIKSGTAKRYIEATVAGSAKEKLTARMFNEIMERLLVETENQPIEQPSLDISEAVEKPEARISSLASVIDRQAEERSKKRQRRFEEKQRALRETPIHKSITEALVNSLVVESEGVGTQGATIKKLTDSKQSTVRNILLRTIANTIGTETGGKARELLMKQALGLGWSITTGESRRFDSMLVKIQEALTPQMPLARARREIEEVIKRTMIHNLSTSIEKTLKRFVAPRTTTNTNRPMGLPHYRDLPALATPLSEYQMTALYGAAYDRLARKYLSARELEADASEIKAKTKQAFRQRLDAQRKRNRDKYNEAFLKATNPNRDTADQRIQVLDHVQAMISTLGLESEQGRAGVSLKDQVEQIKRTAERNRASYQAEIDANAQKQAEDLRYLKEEIKPKIMGDQAPAAEAQLLQDYLNDIEDSHNRTGFKTKRGRRFAEIQREALQELIDDLKSTSPKRISEFGEDLDARQNTDLSATTPRDQLTETVRELSDQPATTAQPTSSTQKSANHLIDYRAQLLQTIERIA